jgi:hypothetical protein
MFAVLLNANCFSALRICVQAVAVVRAARRVSSVKRSVLAMSMRFTYDSMPCAVTH